MDSFELGKIEPPLNDTERLIYDLLGHLHMAQVHHRCHDSSLPPHPDLTQFESEEDIKSAVREWAEACRKHRASDPMEFNSHAPLSELWPTIDAPAELTPMVNDDGDLLFDEFSICHRYVDERRSPAGWIAREYYVGIPTVSKSFRCVVTEGSGRVFCTVAKRSNCVPPAKDDFHVVRVSGTGVNYSTGERRPSIMQLYLPACYGNWALIEHESNPESIVGNILD